MSLGGNATVVSAAEEARKLTSAGAIPVDWEVKSLDELALVTSGKRLPKGSSLVERPTPHPYIRVTDMRQGGVDASEIRYVPAHLAGRIKRYRVFSGDIFISVAGTLGLVGTVPQELDGANLTENADRITKIRCSSQYLMHVLISPLIQSIIEEVSTVGAQPKLALTRLRKFQIPIPLNEREQEAIAEALSDADALINSLHDLIAKKSAIKQGVMQELLSGSRRLPGFSGAWKTRKLADLGTFLKGSGVRKDEAQSGDIPCIRYGELYTEHHDIIRGYRSFISRAVAAGATRLRKGDIVFAGSGETKEDIGKCAAVIGGGEAYAGGDIIILRISEGDPAFLGYALNQSSVRSQKAAQGQGDAVVHISAAALAAIAVCVPEVSEQIAISKIISEVDEEIENLRQYLLKARRIKQGMVQELLSGKVRLV